MVAMLADIYTKLAAGDPAMLAGAVAVMISCSWPLMRTRNAMFAVQMTGASLFGLHYALLGSPTAAVMCTVGIAQTIAITRLRRRAVRHTVFGATIVASLCMTAATWIGLPSALAQTGQLCGAFGRLQRDVQQLRWCFLAGEAMWTAHNIAVGSPWGLLSDTLVVTTLVIGLWRGRPRRRPAAAVSALTTVAAA